MRIRRALAELRVAFAPRDVVVLCYHDVPSRTMFQAQLVVLEHLGYPPLTLDRFRRWLAGGTTDESRGALLTFDGGGRDQLANAPPVLEARGAQGVFFPVSAHLDASSDVGAVTTADVAALVRAGHVAGCHTHTHPRLTRLTPADVEREVTTSKRVLEDATDKPVDVFCDPDGDHDAAVRAVVRRAGFDLAFTVEPGSVRRGHDPLALPRFCILGTPSLAQFRAALSGRFPGALLLYWKLRLRMSS